MIRIVCQFFHSHCFPSVFSQVFFGEKKTNARDATLQVSEAAEAGAQRVSARLVTYPHHHIHV